MGESLFATSATEQKNLLYTEFVKIITESRFTKRREEA